MRYYISKMAEITPENAVETAEWLLTNPDSNLSPGLVAALVARIKELETRNGLNLLRANKLRDTHDAAVAILRQAVECDDSVDSSFVCVKHYPEPCPWYETATSLLAALGADNATG